MFFGFLYMSSQPLMSWLNHSDYSGTTLGIHDILCCPRSHVLLEFRYAAIVDLVASRSWSTKGESNVMAQGICKGPDLTLTLPSDLSGIARPHARIVRSVI
jgi:hypothetical protein